MTCDVRIGNILLELNGRMFSGKDNFSMFWKSSKAGGSEVDSRKKEEEDEKMLGRGREQSYGSSESAAKGKGGAVLSADSEFKGSLTFKESLRIDGKFDGDISSPGMVHIGETGEVKAEINAGNAIVEGKVQGNIIAKEKIELRSTAQLAGDIKASRLVIDDGVVFVGKCEVNPSKGKIEVLVPEKEEGSTNASQQDEFELKGESREK